MRCPACQTENPDDAQRCSSCGRALAPRRRPPRRRGEDGDAAEASNLPALRAYQVSLYGLVPIAGAVLGPAAVILALRALRRGKGDPAFNGAGLARVSILLGSLTAVCNWVGLSLILWGLWR